MRFKGSKKPNQRKRLFPRNWTEFHDGKGNVMTGFIAAILADEKRTRIFLSRYVHGHQQWMLPSHAIPLFHHDYLTDLLPATLRGVNITLPQEQINEQGSPIALLYPTQEIQNADRYQKDQPIVVSLLTVDIHILPSIDPERGEHRFWSVHELPENMLTQHALIIHRVLFAEACHALPVDMNKARVVTQKTEEIILVLVSLNETIKRIGL